MRISDWSSDVCSSDLQLRYVRVLFLRHDRAAGAETVRQVDEAEHRRRPQDQFLTPARQVDQDQAGGRAELDREVAIGHGVERILGDAVEAEQIGRAPRRARVCQYA